MIVFRLVLLQLNFVNLLVLVKGPGLKFLTWVGSKIFDLGRVKKYLGQRRVRLFFTAGQKYAGAGLGQGPSPVIVMGLGKIFLPGSGWPPLGLENFSPNQCTYNASLTSTRHFDVYPPSTLDSMNRT